MMTKNKPDLTPEELARYKVLYALRRIGPEMQSDVLADGVIVSRSGIGVSNPIKLPENLVLDRDALFAAFKKAADGEPIPELRDVGGGIRDLKLEVGDQSAYVSYGNHRIAFPHAALLSEKLARRQRAMAAILKSNTLATQWRDELLAVVNKPNYTQADFFAARTILAGSPETFTTLLREAANRGTIGRKDLLPSEMTHWENLTAKRLTSELLVDFVRDELAAQRASHFTQDLKDALDVVSLTFGSPELVPLETLGQFNEDELLEALRHLVQYTDPFALAGAFDICSNRADSDPRFVTVGEEILDRLLTDPKRLHGELTTFATGFVVATAYLAEHQTLRRQPVFWRRLAAASHAALVTRVLGGSNDEEGSLLNWAMRNTGKSFYLSVMNDFDVEPRWRPDWINPNFIAADVYGRLLASLEKLGDTAPESWRKRLEDARSSITDGAPPMARMFPALLQGWRVPSSDQPPADTPVGKLFTELGKAPTVEKFLEFIQLVYMFGFPPEARSSVLKVMATLRSELATTNPDFAQAALDLAALIAARNHDAELAETVAVVAIERLVTEYGIGRLLPTVSVLLECAAAIADRREALATLARRLENLAFVSPAGWLPDALDAFRLLQSINEDLAPLLGRATATARLGLPRGNAA
ncbi:hypothetical protein ABIB82_006454 [Bradyrhizobium sp. i1.8.4]